MQVSFEVRMWRLMSQAMFVLQRTSFDAKVPQFELCGGGTRRKPSSFGKPSPALSCLRIQLPQMPKPPCIKLFQMGFRPNHWQRVWRLPWPALNCLLSRSNPLSRALWTSSAKALNEEIFPKKSLTLPATGMCLLLHRTSYDESLWSVEGLQCGWIRFSSSNLAINSRRKNLRIEPSVFELRREASTLDFVCIVLHRACNSLGGQRRIWIENTLSWPRRACRTISMLRSPRHPAKPRTVSMTIFGVHVLHVFGLWVRLCLWEFLRGTHWKAPYFGFFLWSSYNPHPGTLKIFIPVLIPI